MKKEDDGGLFDINPKKLGIPKKKKMLPKTVQKTYLGKTYQRGLYAYVASLFKLNETLPRRDKMTDAILVSMIRKEYSEYSTVLARFSYNNPKLQYTISRFRNRYNYGEIGQRIPPQYQFVSFPYNERGYPVNLAKTTLPALTPLKVHERRLKFHALHNKWRANMGLQPIEPPPAPSYKTWLEAENNVNLH